MRFEFKRRGFLLVVSAPSGGGKSEVLKRLRRMDPALDYSVSYTSRPRRPNEVDGTHYRFLTRERFLEMVAAGDFYEHAEVHGNLYGTSAAVVEAARAAGRDLAMDLDVKGGLSVKRRDPGAVLVFLMPPSMEVLEERLRRRASDAEDQIRLRLRNARTEIEQWRSFDYVVLNEEIEVAVAEVAHIVAAERRRADRQEWLERT